MQAGAEIRYAGQYSYHGLTITITDSDSLKLSVTGLWSNELGYGQEYAAETFGLKTFIGTKFNLKIAVTEYSTDSALFKVYVNDQIVGEQFQIYYTDANYKLGLNMSLQSGTIVPDYVLHELTWSDFGITCGSASNDKKQLLAGRNINNSLFNGDVTMQAGSEIRYIGGYDYTGLEIGVNASGNLTLETINIYSKYHNNQTEFLAETCGLDTFINTRFNLKIAVTEYSTQSATVRVWVNEQMVGEAFALSSYEEANLLGTYMSLYIGTIVPHEATDDDEQSELTPLTWSDFNIPCGEVSTVKNQLSSGKNINNSLFSGDITMQAGSDIRYLGSTDFGGLIITVTDAGALNLSTAGMWSNDLGSGVEFSADTFGLTTFANTRFNLKIAVTE